MAKHVHQSWSSKLAFVLATTGAAVGLGNLWGFPFLAGENGGAAFIFIYIACVVLIGVPVITAEIAMGRMGHLSPIGTIRALIKSHGAGRGWQAIGFLSLAVPFVGFTFYSVIAGFSIDYLIKALEDAFLGITPDGSGQMFGALNGNGGRTILLQGAVIMLTALVVGAGLRRGIERTVKVMMPGLFIILLVMAGYGYLEADFAGAVSFLFTPDFSQVSAKTVMIALGQAFFSVGVGVGFMITYGAYLPGEARIPRLAGAIAGVDTLVALLAGVAIFPIVFASGLSPAEGPGLVFLTMPVAFGAMPLGQFIGIIFFLLLFVAAFTSTLGMLEPMVSYMEERWRKSRFFLAFSAAAVIWAVGLMPALSGSLLADVRLLSFIPGLADRDVFSSFYFITAALMIPLNAFLIALFAGWVIKPALFKKELGFSSNVMFQAWHALVKFIVPLAVLAITVFGLMG